MTVYSRLCSSSAQRVRFFERSSVAPMNHITGTTCRPDFLAISAGSAPSQVPQSPDTPRGGPVLTQSPSIQAPQSPDMPESQVSELSYGSRFTHSYKPESSESSGSSESPQAQAVSWVDVEIVVGFYSTGTKMHKGTKQALAYTSYLLQQRPDRVAVLGLYISRQHFSLVLMDATNLCYTTLHWNDESARHLLFRVLYYINDPPGSMMDPTIIRTDNNTFTINVKGEDYEGCTLVSCGHPTGCRTVVF